MIPQRLNDPLSATITINQMGCLNYNYPSKTDDPLRVVDLSELNVGQNRHGNKEHQGCFHENES